MFNFQISIISCFKRYIFTIFHLLDSSRNYNTEAYFFVRMLCLSKINLIKKFIKPYSTRSFLYQNNTIKPLKTFSLGCRKSFNEVYVLPYVVTVSEKSRSLAFHFRPTSGSLGPHRWSYEVSIIQFFKKIEFRKICGHTDGKK